jgi:hypothetical protein
VITINTNGGTIASPGDWTGGPSAYAKTIPYGGPIDLPTIERTGYNLNAASWPSGQTVSGIRTFTPAWTAIQYTVTLDPAGGTITAAGWTNVGTVYTKTFDYNTPIGTLPTPTKSGNTFGGWASAPASTTPVTDNITVTANAWTPVSGPSDPTGPTGPTTTTYTITINPNGGTAASPGSWTVSSTGTLYKTFTSGDSIGSLPTLTREGYAFTGWSSTLPTKVTSSATFTAQWEPVASGSIVVHITLGDNEKAPRSYDITAAAGSDVEFTVEPASGYIIDKVTTTGEYSIDGNRITLKNVDTDRDVSVSFAEEADNNGFPWLIVAIILIVLIILIIITRRLIMKGKISE